MFIGRKVHLILIAFCLKLLLLFLWFRLVLSCHKKEKEKKSTARLLTLKPSELPGRIQMPSIYCCCKVQSGATAWEPYLKHTEKLKWAHYTIKDYKLRNAGCIGQMLQGLECPQLWRLPQIAVPHHAPQNCHWSDTSYPARKHPNTRTAGECIIHNTQQQSESDNTVIRHQQYSGLCEHSKTEQCCSSFFVRAMAEWNHLSEETVYASQTFVKDCLPSVSYAVQDHVFILL